MTMKILLDTDIGSDIDDALCLAYLLAQPACELLGITTVTGEATQRAMLASALCKVAGKSIPILPGAEQPLIIPQRQPLAPQAAALVKWDHDPSFPQGEAVEFLRQTIRQHPGEITLLCIGPLTNIGLLFATDPEIPSLLKAIVLMCGLYLDPSHGFRGEEWNAKLDPHASSIVYRARVPIHRSVGVEITTQVMMSAADVRAQFTARLLEPVLDFAEVWFKEQNHITFHDPLTATTIFDSSICTFEKGSVEIELEDEEHRGQTIWRITGADPWHEVARSVDVPRFFAHYLGVFAE